MVLGTWAGLGGRYGAYQTVHEEGQAGMEEVPLGNVGPAEQEEEEKDLDVH